MAKTLIYDIETAPNLSYTWGKWEQDVVRFEREWYLLSVAWRWLGEKPIHVLGLDDFPLRYKRDKTDDLELTTHIHGLFSEADIVVAHNGNSFDQKKSQARMLVHGLEPPTPYRQIDTKLVSRKYFNFNSNALNDLAQILNIGSKVKHPGFDLWLGCMAGDEPSWRLMKKYNKGDVELLTRCYEKMLPWIDGHPNIGLLDNKPDACPKCGKGPLVSRGYKMNATTRYQQFQCSECGGYCRARTLDKSIPKPLYTN